MYLYRGRESNCGKAVFGEEPAVGPISARVDMPVHGDVAELERLAKLDAQASKLGRRCNKLRLKLFLDYGLHCPG
jgi:hypothetical protein